MRFEALASSSAGNLYVVDDGETRILLECGLTRKKLKALTKFEQFDACLVSHEHKDHAHAAKDLVMDGMPVYMSEGTAEALELGDTIIPIEHGEQFAIGTLNIVPFSTFHDAREPLGFLIRSRLDGDTLAFATDTVNLRYKFPGVTLLAIEANYDHEIMEGLDGLPEKVKRRIRNSHMEIGTLCDYLRGLDLSKCREIYLLHLSDSTSKEWDFVNRVRASVPAGIRVTACSKGINTPTRRKRKK